MKTRPETTNYWKWLGTNIYQEFHKLRLSIKLNNEVREALLIISLVVATVVIVVVSLVTTQNAPLALLLSLGFAFFSFSYVTYKGKI